MVTVVGAAAVEAEVAVEGLVEMSTKFEEAGEAPTACWCCGALSRAVSSWRGYGREEEGTRSEPVEERREAASGWYCCWD